MTRRLALAVGVAAGLAWTAAPLLAATSTPSVATAGAPLTGAVVAAPGGASTGYATKVVVVTQGSSLSFVNLDQLSHTVTSVLRDKHGNPLFSTSAGPTATAPVAGVRNLPAGQYSFYCQFHPNMTGTLVVASLTGGGGGPPAGAAPTFPLALRIPPVLTGSHITIPVRESDVRVMPSGPKTLMWTYGGTYPGPTIRRPAGHGTTVTFVNHLPQAVGALTVHLHGDHHSSADDGQPDTALIPPGARRTYKYPLTNAGKPERAATDFYHDHRMDVTGRNDWNGLQGMFLVDDRKELSLPLPRGQYDVPLFVSDRSLDDQNQLLEPFPDDPTPGLIAGLTGAGVPPGDQTVGSRILVNGTYSPHFDVAARHYRFRIVNGSNFTSYEFHLSTNQPMTQIGTGSGLLPAPVRRQSILLGPAQRADVVVDFHHELGKRVLLQSIATTDTRPGAIGTPIAPIMQFRITHTAEDDSRVPAVLEPLSKLSVPSLPTFAWTFGLGGDLSRGLAWTVNGRAFDPTRSDSYVALGSTQRWLLTNLSPLTHYIHLHEEEWRTISRDGQAPPPWERGLEDTWRLDPGETVEVAAKVTDFTGRFMVHCHMLDHEDHGMMAQFDVVKPGDPRLHGLPAAPGLGLLSGAGMADDMSMPMSESMSGSMSGSISGPMSEHMSGQAVQPGTKLAALGIGFTPGEERSLPWLAVTDRLAVLMSLVIGSLMLRTRRTDAGVSLFGRRLRPPA